MWFRHLPAAALLFLLSTIPAGSAALSFSVELPDLVGPFPSGYEPGPVASFDFEQEFLAIQGAWLEVEARVTALQFERCGTLSNPQPCVRVVRLIGFFSLMDKEGSPNPGFVFSDGLVFWDDPSALEASGTDTVPFKNPLVGWDFLLDGRGSLTLFWNDIYFIDDIIIDVSEPGGEIFAARLILDATPVPEPSTGTLVLLALALLAAARRPRTIAISGWSSPPC